ncbi:MAG: hypothetical protein CM1200mP2_07940 [Planctomycetaceae bacterium]|nr:MAG: hypothetical protein CM1200mP2_07940 [Planctomycetaceae bacterium]
MLEREKAALGIGPRYVPLRGALSQHDNQAVTRGFSPLVDDLANQTATGIQHHVGDGKNRPETGIGLVWGCGGPKGPRRAVAPTSS